MSDDKERHSELKSVPPRPSMTPEEQARHAAKNGLRQFDALAEQIRSGIDAYRKHGFRLRPSTLMTLDRLAVDGMVDGPGAYRRGPIMIGGAKHQPPDADRVAEFVDGLCDYVNDNWGRPAIHLAAYVMWRLNWIHPFEDGNGRTSRAASYLVLCVRLQTELPGAPSIPDLIAANKQPYYAALEQADVADVAGRIDVSAMEVLLEAHLLTQVKSAASTTGERRTRSLPAGKQADRATTQGAAAPKTADGAHDWTKIAVVCGVIAAAITALATMLSTADGQRLLGCSASPPGAKTIKPLSTAKQTTPE